MFRGQFKLAGGRSHAEVGGSATAFILARNEESKDLETTVIIDNTDDYENQGRPLKEFIAKKEEDSGRSVLVTMPEDDEKSLTINHFYLRGGAHLALQNTTEKPPNLVIKYLYGDYSGMLHTSSDQEVFIIDSLSPFPVSFRVYPDSFITFSSGECIL